MSSGIPPISPASEDSSLAPDSDTVGLPRQLGDRYCLDAVLGKGGFGTTYQARNVALPGQPVCVIKRLQPATDDAQVREMALSLLEREAKTLGRIGTHPQIPALLDYFFWDNDFYLVQEFVSGQTLEQEIHEKGIFSEVAVKQFLTEMLPILDYLQRQKVIHRDIKPSNILRRSQDKRLVLIDFGAVKDEVQTVFAGSGNTALTAFSIGTPGYAPPEQLALRPVFSSDIYALGATCLFLMTGKKPRDLGFSGETGELLWRKHVLVSNEFAQVLGRMLELPVRNRFRTASEVLRAMAMESYSESLSQGLILPQPEPSRASPLARFGQQLQSHRQSYENSQSLGDRRSDRSQVTSGSTLQRPQWQTGDDILRYYQRGQRDFGHRTYNALRLDRATLPQISFHSAQLREANFSQSDLSEATFSYAQLTRADLHAAKLTGAYLNATDLRYANLRGADLSHATFTEARFENTDLRGANLRGAKLTEEQMQRAKINWRTVLPSGERGSGL
jgi:serine/threonine protein kinase, bacterial